MAALLHGGSVRHSQCPPNSWIPCGSVWELPVFTKALGPSADLSGTPMPTQALDLL